MGLPRGEVSRARDYKAPRPPVNNGAVNNGAVNSRGRRRSAPDRSAAAVAGIEHEGVALLQVLFQLALGRGVEVAQRDDADDDVVLDHRDMEIGSAHV